MFWLNKVVKEIITKFPDGEIVVSSGVSPSGKYHLGTLREVLTAEAIAYQINRMGRKARHIHVADDLDVFRKVPANVPEEFERYLGMPLCDIPAPDGSPISYADYYLNDLLNAAKDMNLQMEIMRAHEKYRSGFFVNAIEKTLDNVDKIKQTLESISGHKVDEDWSPIQVVEDGYLKNRKFVSINTNNKTLVYIDRDGKDRVAGYDKGEVKLNWRIDWPARWWLLGVRAEPFGRDHATKGGSYDTGSVLVKEIFGMEPPVPVPYDFVNITGETKKMSKSAGNVVTASELLKVLPSEVVWYFILRYAPDKLLFFDETDTLIKLIDEFGELLAKPEKTVAEKQLVEACLHDIERPKVSRVPFTLLVASYQASLKNAEKTIEIITRTEYKDVAIQDSEIIKEELKYIDGWLEHWAPENVKFSLIDNLEGLDIDESQKAFLKRLAEKISAAPESADGNWFHRAIYEAKEDLSNQDTFNTLYQVLIGKNFGPRAGWFLSILPRNWLIKRLNLEA